MSEQFRKKGLCYKCGQVKTHRKKVSLLRGTVLEPLNTEGKVYEGYCLKCHALEEVLSFLGVKSQLEVKKTSPKRDEKELKRDTFVPVSLISCSPSLETQQTSSSETSTGSGKPPLRPRSRTVNKDTDVLDYSSAEEDIDSASSIGSSNSTGRQLRLTQSEDSIELSLPKSLDSVLRDMKRHPTDATVQEFGCAALGQLKVEQLHGSSAAIEAILKAMNLYPEHLGIHKEGVRNLRRLTFKASKSEDSSSAAVDKRHLDKEMCGKIERRGGIRTVFNTLKTFPGCRPLQRDSLRIIRNILGCNSTVTGTNIDCEAINSIIKAMVMHGESKSVQEDGCALLWIVSYNEPSYQMKIVELNGLSAIMSALVMQREVEQVHYHGCGAIHTLSCNAEIKPIVINAGGLSIAFRSIEEHGYSPLVTEKACSAIATLMIQKRSEKKLCVMQPKEIKDIIRSMEIHSNSRLVQKSAIRTLELVARSRSNLAVLKTCTSLRSVLLAAVDMFPEECSRPASRIIYALDNR